MEKKELVVYGENGQIVDCKFQRVDFDQPATILSYCEDVKDEIGRILDTTAQMAVDSQEVQVDENMISAITSFDESLDESERKKEKEEKLPVVVKKFKGILSSITGKKEEEEETTYKGRYQEYCRGIEEVCVAVESQKQGSLNDIQLRDSIIKELMPLIEQLEEMIKVGQIDKATYDEAIAKLKELPPNMDTEYEIQYKTQLSEVFNGKLNELEKALVLYKEQIQSYRLQQRTDMELVMNSDSYLRDSAPILKAQGSVMVFNRQQENRIKTMARLNEATNTAIVNNARELEQNAEGAVELSLNKGVSASTLSVLDASLKKGIAIYKEGRAKRQEQIEKDRQTLLDLNSSLETYQTELLQLIDDDGVMAELLKKDSSNRGTKRPPQKRIGSKK